MNDVVLEMTNFIKAPLSVTNNLSIPPSISTPSLSPSVASIDSTTNTSPEKKKKSKKKKVN